MTEKTNLKALGSTAELGQQTEAWAIFTDITGEGGWCFHSAHWSRERARYFAKSLEQKTRVRKIVFVEVPNAKVSGVPPQD